MGGCGGRYCRQAAAVLSVVAVVVLFGVLFGCSGASSGSNNITINPPGTPGTPAAPPPQASHVVIVVEENHSYSQVMGNAAMPYLNQLAAQNAVATQYFANAHPSLPNYFMLTTGQPVTLNDNFNGTVSDDNVVRQLVSAGKSWKIYAEGLPAVGYTGPDLGPYVRHHNPFAYLSDVNGTPQAQNMVPFSQFSADLAAGQLPNFSFVVPNLLHDSHNCPNGASACADNDKLSGADTWLQQNIGPLLGDANFQQSGVLMIVFDEGQMADINGGGGQVAMIMAGTGVKKGFQSTQRYEHAALLRAALTILGVSHYPGAAAAAPSMGEFF